MEKTQNANDRFIERALQKAKQVKDDEIGFVAADTMDGWIYKIWYRTIGDDNRLERYEVITDEQWDWEKAGCKNNEEWHRHLNRQFWQDYTPGMKVKRVEEE